MLARTIDEWNDRHAITGGEVAYPLLVGTFTREGVGWHNNAVPAKRTLWPVTLLSAYTNIVNTAGASRLGHVLYLKTILLNTSDAMFDLESGITSALGPITWHGELDCDYGFAMAAYQTLIATDTIFTRWQYRRRLP